MDKKAHTRAFLWNWSRTRPAWWPGCWRGPWNPPKWCWWWWWTRPGTIDKFGFGAQFSASCADKQHFTHRKEKEHKPLQTTCSPQNLIQYMKLFIRLIDWGLKNDFIRSFSDNVYLAYCHELPCRTKLCLPVGRSLLRYKQPLILIIT